MRRPVTGAILAGGKSRRMGRPKAHIVLPDGRTMAETVRDALVGVCERVVVVGDASVLPELPHVQDIVQDAGPLGGIHALLMSGLGERYLVCPCDMPGLTEQLLHALCNADAGAALVFPQVVGSDETEPFPMRIDSTLHVHVMERLEAGNRALHHFLAGVGGVAIPIDAELGCELCNLNDNADVQAFLHSQRIVNPTSSTTMESEAAASDRRFG